MEIGGKALLSYLCGHSQALDASQVPAELTVALLQFVDEKMLVKWGLITREATAQILAILAREESNTLSFQEVERMLSFLWDPWELVDALETFTNAEGIHFYYDSLLNDFPTHGRWVESVCDLSSVYFELVELVSPSSFSVCFFYRGL